MSYDLFLIVNFVIVVVQWIFIFKLFRQDLPEYRFNKQNDISYIAEKKEIILDILMIALSFLALFYLWETHLEYVKKLMGL